MVLLLPQVDEIALHVIPPKRVEDQLETEWLQLVVVVGVEGQGSENAHFRLVCLSSETEISWLFTFLQNYTILDSNPED